MKKKSYLVTFTLIVCAIVAILAVFSPFVAKGITKGLDLDGGFEIVYKVSPLNETSQLPSMSSVARSVSKRIDILGVSEPQISIEGSDRIRVQLAGVKDLTQAQKIISTTANLSFRDVHDKLLMDSTVLKEAGASLSFENGIPVVSLKIADSDKFAEVTALLAGKGNGENLIITWLDFDETKDSYAKEYQKFVAGEKPAYISAASVTTRIDGDAVIKGNFTQETARELADLINAGSLPVKMTELYSNVVSAEYGQDAFNKAVFAGILGVIGVMAFMIFIYRLPGAISALVLPCFIFLNLLIYNAMGGVLTLPGIAALILGVGMTVDANVVTFERIRDELYLGRTVKKAYKEGHSLAFWTIFDSQFTTFISAIIMYIFGTGAVKGFATMFMVTVFCTLTLQIFLTKFLLGLLVNSGYLDGKTHLFRVKQSDCPDVTKNEERRYFGIFANVDFVKLGKKAVIGSLVLILLGVGSSIYYGVKDKQPLNLGIDFVSGTTLTVVSNKSLTDDALRVEFEKLGYSPSKIQISGADAKMANITLADAVTPDKMHTLKTELAKLYGSEPNDSVVTPLVGRELVRNAFLLSIVAWFAMFVYISFRFKWDYAIACIAALLHDVLIVLVVFAIFRFEVNSNLIAVILAIIGYSIDDSIVIFDRVRENVRNIKKPKLDLKDYEGIVNKALCQTAERSLYNTITTVIPVVFLLVLASQEIFTFTIAIFVGLIAGAYSSLFLAPQLWLWIRVNIKPKDKPKKKKKKKDDGPKELTFVGVNDIQ